MPKLNADCLLIKRGTYWTRRASPKDLADQIGRADFTRPLHTKNKREATTRSRLR